VRLGYNTNGLQNHRLEDGLALLADHGYEAVAITPDVCHLDPFSVTPAAVDALAARLQRLSLLPVMETGARFLLDPRRKHEPTLMTRDPAARARRLDLYRRIARIGVDLGARVVSFWTGIDHAKGPDSAAWMQDGVRASCAHIRAAGLVPALEPEPGMAIETTTAWSALHASLGAEAPALALDIGHLYAVWEGEPAEVIRRLGPHIVQVHLEDMRKGVHEHLVPGSGDVDFGDVLTAIASTGYTGPVCFELARSSHCAPTAVASCSELWKRILPALRR
jgi:sugar phosphate isomerase/epimerase